MSQINYPEFEGCDDIGSLVASIAKDAIMRGYEQGVIPKQDAIDLIATLGLTHE